MSTTPYLYNPRTRRKVFVSYHHHGDQHFYDAFANHFGERLELFYDNSLERRIDSNDVTYIMRRIRENHLHGSSCTIVLCGRETYRRKYVDWEIQASLAQQMGVVGIMLPTIEWIGQGTNKPSRLQRNLDTGYAKWISWETIVSQPDKLIEAIELANASPKGLIINSAERMLRNA